MVVELSELRNGVVFDLEKKNLDVKIKLRYFQGGDYHFLDNNVGHQGSSATYRTAKNLVTSDHLRKPPGMGNTPENSTINERTMEDSDVT